MTTMLLTSRFFCKSHIMITSVQCPSTSRKYFEYKKPVTLDENDNVQLPDNYLHVMIRK